MERFLCGKYYDRIGENVRRIRMEKGLTQERLAEKTKLSLAAIQKVEAGHGGLRFDTFIRIALVFNVSLDVLADVRQTDIRHAFEQEAVYLLLNDKSADEIRYVIAVIDSIFRYKEQYLD